MIWEKVWRSHKGCLELADRHYSRRSPGSGDFMPPGRCVCLFARDGDGSAVWGTSWQRHEYVKHAFGDCWNCTIFRNETGGRGSDLVRQAVAATRFVWGEPPSGGFLTFVRPDRVRPKKDPGHVFIMAGFRPCGTTSGGLLAFRMEPERMPGPEQPLGMMASLF